MCVKCGKLVNCDYAKQTETQTKTKDCENRCPKCNSDNIKWQQKEIGDVIYQPATCLDCGCEFKEYWTYSDTEWED